MYKYMRIHTNDVIDRRLIIRQSLVLICNTMFTRFEPAFKTSLTCHPGLSESHHQYKLCTTANYSSVITLA